MTTNSLGGRSLAFYVWIGLLGLLVLQGLYSVYRQTVEGHYLSGQSDLVPWGLYIVGFVFFVGTSAGATIIGLLIHAFGRDDYAPLGTRALLVGFLSLAAAVTFILVDVGNVWKLMLVPWVWRNPTSMFMYTSLTYYLFAALFLGELYYAVRITRGIATTRDRRVAKWLAIAAVPFALWIVHAPHGALFAVIEAREFWNSPLLPPHFAIAALVSGTSVMTLIAIGASLSGRRTPLVSKATLSHMGFILAFLISVTLFFDFFDGFVHLYADGTESGPGEILAGRYAPMLLIQEGGLVLALTILLFKRGRTAPGLAIASALAIVAIATYRYLLIPVGLQVPLFPFLGEISYSPSLIEVSVAVGIVALAILAYSVLSRILPMEDAATAS